MPAQPSAVELLAALAKALGKRRWYLFDAQAVNVHGRPRMTADVDVTVDVRRRGAPRLIADLVRAGFDLRVDNPAEFVRATSVLPFVHRATGMPLDLVLAESGLEAMFLERARLLDVGGLLVPVIAAADLIVTKILAGRPKDLEDAASVLRESGDDIALGPLRRLIRELERALDQSDLTPALERIVASSGGASGLPKPKRIAKKQQTKKQP